MLCAMDDGQVVHKSVNVSNDCSKHFNPIAPRCCCHHNEVVQECVICFLKNHVVQTSLQCVDFYLCRESLTATVSSSTCRVVSTDAGYGHDDEQRCG